MKNYKSVGDRIYIRSITYDDTEKIVHWRNQPNVRCYFIYRKLFTGEIHDAWMKKFVEKDEVAQFIICRNSDNKAIGSTYLRDIDYDNLCAEYGVFIGDESDRGHGIGKEALKLTLKFAHEELGLRRIISRAISTNQASIQSFLHSGFHITEELSGVECTDGEIVDVVMMEHVVE